MNKLKSYIVGMAAAIALGSAFSSCQNDFDPYVPTVPEATMTANTTIAEIKQWMWNDSENYCKEVYTRDYYLGNTTDPEEGEHVIISGRVVSSDYAGNCFKYIILQDQTGALTFSINSYNLYLMYRRGQEVVVDLTGIFMGKYRGLEQVGFPDWNSSNNDYETSFMAPEFFAPHRQLNGLPQLDAIDTILIASFSEIGTTAAEQQKWQSQLIRINNVTFSQSEDAAEENINTLSTYHSSGLNQVVTDAQGNTMNIRTSGYATFWNTELPSKPVDLVALLSYYATTSGSPWQLTLIDIDGIITDATAPKGTQDNPYSIEDAIAFQLNGTTTTGWVSGFIVGTVAPEVTEVTSSQDIEWSANPILGNTMVIGPSADCTDIDRCLIIELNQGTPLYNESLHANSDNYGKSIAIRGTFTSVMGSFGMITAGLAGDFVLEGQGGSDNPNIPADAITVEEAITWINAGNTGTKTVKGVIRSLKTFHDSYGQITYYIGDPGSTNSLQVYGGLGLNGAEFTSINDLKVGAYVVVQGSLKAYNNSPEIDLKSVILYYDPDYQESSTGGDTPGGDTPGGDTPGGDTPTTPSSLTVAQAIQYITSGNIPTSAVKVAGVIATVENISTAAGYANYIIKDNEADAQGLYISRGMWLNGEKFTADTEFEVGTNVVVEGTLVYYGNTTPMMQNSSVVSYGGELPSGVLAVFDFTDPTSLSPSYTATAPADQAFYNVSDVAFTNNGVTVKASKGNSTDARIYYQTDRIQYRVYNGAKLTVTSTKPMASITFDIQSATNEGVLQNNGTQYTRSNPTAQAGGATSMVFDCTVNIQINRITVEFAD